MYIVKIDSNVDKAHKVLYSWKKAQHRKNHASSHDGRRATAGKYIRYAANTNFYDDEGRIIFKWVPRGKIKDNAFEMSDLDWYEWRARHSTGWKEHKHRYQWGHNVCEKEKHQKSRARKALRRGENPWAQD